MKQKPKTKQQRKKRKQNLKPSPLFRELIRMLAKSVARRLKKMQE